MGLFADLDKKNTNSYPPDVQAKIDSGEYKVGQYEEVHSDLSAAFAQDQNEQKKSVLDNIMDEVKTTNAYKKYMYNREDVLQEAKNISIETGLPENAILSSSENLDKARDIYNYRRKQMALAPGGLNDFSMEKVAEAYPEVQEIARLSDTDAAIALHNIENVKQVKTFVEACEVGLKTDELNHKIANIGRKGMYGDGVTDEDLKEYADLQKQLASLPEIPGLADNFAISVVGNTSAQIGQQVRGAVKGMHYAALDAAAGGIAGAAIGGSAGLGVGAAPGAITGFLLGASKGMQHGWAQDMLAESAATRFMEYTAYKDKNGKQLISDDKARAYALAGAAVETAIEFANAKQILRVASGIKGKGIGAIREIVKNSANAQEMQSGLTNFLKGAGKNAAKDILKVSFSESGEEGLQQSADLVLSNIMSKNNPDGNIPTYNVAEIVKGGAEAFAAALPSSIGFGLGAQSIGSLRLGYHAAKMLNFKDAAYMEMAKNAQGVNLLQALQNDKNVKAFMKKDPEVAKQVIKNTVKGTAFDHVNVDTELAAQKEGGLAVLYQMGEAAGISRDEMDAAIENKADISIPTEVYYQNVADNPSAKGFEELTSFSDTAPCFARNKYYAEMLADTTKKLMDKDLQKQAQAIDTLIKNNFTDEGEREAAASVILQYPDNPKAGAVKVRQNLQAELDAKIGPIVSKLKAGMGNGTSVIENLDGTTMRSSNNDAWYSNFYEDHGRAPNQQELQGIAIKIYLGEGGRYKLADEWNGPQNEEEAAMVEQDRANFDSLLNRINALDTIKDKISVLSPSEIAITQGLTPEGYRVYKKVADVLQSGNKEVKQAGRMGAIVFAKHADRMAQIISGITKKPYTAEDYYRERLTIEPNAALVGENGLMQAAAMRKENKTFVQNKNGNINWGYITQDITADDGTVIKAAPIRMQIGFQVGGLDSHQGAGYTHIIRRIDFFRYRGFKSVENAVCCILEKYDFVSKLITNESKDRILISKELPTGEGLLLSLDLEYDSSTNEAYYTVVSLVPQTKVQLTRSKQKALSFDGRLIPSAGSGAGVSSTPTAIKAGSLGDLLPNKESAFGTVSLSDAEELVKKYTYDENENQQKQVQNNLASEQFSIIKQSNPMQDNVHTGIRSAEDIKTYSEAIEEFGDGQDITPDFKAGDVENALNTGEITVYSSKPLGNGAFVTPSKMEAKNYAGTDKLYSMKVSLNDVAWIDAIEGQYAPVSKETVQQYTSAGTSLKQIPALFKKMKFAKGSTNIDIGGGKYDLATKYVEAQGARNIVFDPFNRTSEHNLDAFNKIKAQGDTATVANVLNVIAEKGARENVILQAAKAIKSNGTAYFGIYEGSKTGVGAKTSKGWQNNKATADYIDEVKKYFGNVTRKGNVIIATNPRFGVNDKAVWSMSNSPSENVLYQDQQASIQEQKIVLGSEQLYKDVQAWCKTVDNRDKLNPNKMVDVMTTPLVMELAGIERLPIKMEYSKFAHILEGHADSMGPEQLKALPAALTNPLFIAKSKGNILVALDIPDKNGTSIVSFFSISKEDTEQNKVNLLLSTYGKDGAYGKSIFNSSTDYKWFINNFLNKPEKILYLNKEKTTNWLSSEGLKVPQSQSSISSLSIDSIPNETDLRKRQLEYLELYQKHQLSPQGQIAIAGRGQAIISLFQSANQSTFMHEMGHLALADLKMVAEMEGAPEQVVKDWETAKKWLGWKEGQTAFTTAQQEKFARTFEAYLRSGEAPSADLKGVFRKFKKWLTGIYKDVMALGGEVSPEIKGVMDRMLATEEEVEDAAAMRRLDEFKKQGGTDYLAPDSAAMYGRWVEEAKAKAKEKVLKTAMQDIVTKQAKDKEAFLATMRSGIMKELKQKPVFIAEQLLKLNPSLKDAWPSDRLGMTYEEYRNAIANEGGSIEAAADTRMKAEQKLADSYAMNADAIREEAEKALSDSKYVEMSLALEQEALAKRSEQNRVLTDKIGKTLDGIEADLRKDYDTKVREDAKANGEPVPDFAKKQSDEESPLVKSLRHRIAELKYSARWTAAEQKQILAIAKAKSREEKLKLVKDFRKYVKINRTKIRLYRDSAVQEYRAVRKFAAGQMDSMSISDATNVKKWRSLERRAGFDSARELARAVTKDKSPATDTTRPNPKALPAGKNVASGEKPSDNHWALAVQAKMKQRTYAAMAAQSQKNKDKLEKAAATLGKRKDTIFKNNNIPADERYYYVHGLYILGLISKDIPAPVEPRSINDVIADYKKVDQGLGAAKNGEDPSALGSPFGIDEEGNPVNIPAWITAAISGNTPFNNGYKSLKMSEFSMFKKVLDVIYKIGIDQNKIKTMTDPDGKSVTVEDVAEAIAAEAEQNVPAIDNPDTTNIGSPTDMQKIITYARKTNLSLIKPETLLLRLGKTAHRFIYDTINEAWNRAKSMEIENIKQLNQIWGVYTSKELSKIRSSKDFTLGTSHLTKEEVMCLALNWGTEINRKRVLGSSPDIDEAAVNALFGNLDTRDWQVIQNLWDYVSSYWEDTVKVEERTSGITLEKQKALPFEILGDDGQLHELRGGYYPIKYDFNKSIKASSQQAEDIAKAQYPTNAALGRRRGHTKQRSTADIQNRPLQLSFRVIDNHLSDVIHNICYREQVRDVGRILNNETVQQVISERYGMNAVKLLQQWNRDNWAQDISPQDIISKMATQVRHGATAMVLGWRLSTSILNVLNLSPMVEYLGAGRSGEAIANFYKHPKANWKLASSKSVFLRKRAETMDRDVREILQTKSNVPGYSFLKQHAFDLMALTDLSVATPLWLSEYQRVYQDNIGKVVDFNSIEREAVAAGDKAVRLVFGSGDIKDLSAVQKSQNEVTKAVTMYYSYFNLVYNSIADSVYEAKKRRADGANIARSLVPVARKLLFWCVLTGIGEGLLRAAWDKDDDDWDSLFAKCLKGISGNAFGAVPILRDIAEGVTSRIMGDRVYANGPLPILDLFDNVLKTWSIATSDKKDFTDALRQGLRVSSYVTGLGNTVTDAFTTSLKWMHTDFDAPIWDWLKAVAFDQTLDTKEQKEKRRKKAEKKKLEKEKANK